MKVLIISANAFSSITNNGKTIEAIFSSFKTSELFQLFSRPHDIFINYDYALSYYVVSEIDIIKKIINPFSSCGGEAFFYSYDQKKLRPFNFIQKGKIKNWFFLRDLIWSTNLWKSKQLRKWCLDIHPDAVFLVAGNCINVHILGRYISNYLDIPLVTFFTDDYIIYPVVTSLYAKLKKYRIQQYYLKTVAKSDLLFCIGEIMAKEYSKYYNKKFLHIMNAVDINSYIIPSKKNNIIFSYFGGIHLDRWKMIVKLSELVPSYVTFKVYTHSVLSDDIISAFKKQHIICFPSIEGDDLKNAMQNSDILLHVESDDMYFRSLTRLSISTKIPEYLISGRMVIGFGPPEVASMKLLSDNNIGLVISSDNDNNYNRIILEHVINDKEYIEKMGQIGYEYAVKNFDKKIISNTLKELLLEINKNHEIV